MARSANEVFHGYDAVSGEILEPAYEASTAIDVEQVCAAAKNAFDPYREIASHKRAEFLEAVGDEIMALGDALIDRASAESGLPRLRLIGERGRTVGQLRLFADVVRSDRWRQVRIDPALPQREPVPRPQLALRMVPLGPVAVFGASNFPFAFSTAGGDTASALAAGCPVVVKGHPAHPGTDLMVAQAVQRAANRTGMPEGVFGHLMGPGNALGAALAADPRIQAVAFTGSRTGGLALKRIAEKRPVPVPVYAEMSSVNPVLLLPGALESRGESLGKDFVGSLILGAGQFCTNPGLVLGIRGEGLDAFESAAAQALREEAAQVMLTSDICKAFAEGVGRLELEEGVELLARGQPGAGHNCEPPHLFATDAALVLRNHGLLEEVFGAASLIVRCSGPADMKAIIEGMEGQLTATLQMDDKDYPLAAELLPLLETKCGRILANGWPTGVEVSHAMVHGGPFPATTDPRATSVGTLAIERFLRPVCYQNVPEALLPDELQATADVPRLVDGEPA